MSLRLSHLPPGLRQLALGQPSHFSHVRHAHRWSGNAFFYKAPLPIHGLGRRALWLIPVAGGIGLLLKPQPKSVLPQVLQDDAFIPCNRQTHRPQPIIYSPYEADQSLLSRFGSFLRNTILEPLITAGRFAYLFCLFFPVIVASPMLLVGTPAPELQGDRWGAVWWYDLLLIQMERAGPTFIKLAQWAGSRVDLFPSLLCQRLGRLHSEGKPHSFWYTRRVLEKIFKRPLDQIFEKIDETPIGTGAIAQVYKATLKQDVLPPSYQDPKRKKTFHPAALALPHPPSSVPTATVAMKVLHPFVEKMISRDLAIMSFFAGLITLLPGMEWLSLKEEVEVFGRMMYEQLDLRNEAEKLDLFEKNFAHRRLPISFPRPLKTWSTKDILIEEYETALPLELFLKNGGGPYDRQLAEIGLDAFLNMLLLDNFVHADLHPGNIMVKLSKPLTTWDVLSNIWASLMNKVPEKLETPAPDWDDIFHKLNHVKHSPAQWRSELSELRSQGYIPEVVFIDAGLTNTLDSIDRKNFLDLFRAIAEFDGYRSGKLMVERCRTPHLVVDEETFALKMQHIVLNVKRKTFSLGQIKISDILSDVLKAVRDHHVKMEADFVNTVISTLLLEGIGRQLDPELDLFKSSLPILRQLGRQMTSEQSLESMKDLHTGSFGTFIKLWVLMEARGLVNASIVNADEMVRYDWLSPSI
ncbi:ABC1-domain-containing protein [Thelephora terrestris]|uniref:ABC1-domain-containing protein n=1 Tax=Thelephora terrestris TaxID=56493 RepID=A0A9P6HFL8_9AGAM|nr:ABC1-domain-containing protein [Thelephora terrestris]